MSALAYHRMPGPGDLPHPNDPQNEPEGEGDDEPLAFSDPLEELSYRRSYALFARRWRLGDSVIAGFIYERLRKKVMSGYPMAQNRMIEAAIKCDLTCREAVNAMRRAVQ